jgi:hypothetical protein
VGVEIDVLPGEPGHLAAPHAGRGEQQPGGVQPIRLHVLQEGPQLAADHHAARCRSTVGGCSRRVVGLTGILPRSTADLNALLRMPWALTMGLGRVARAVASAGALQRVVEAFEVLGLQVP